MSREETEFKQIMRVGLLTSSEENFSLMRKMMDNAGLDGRVLLTAGDFEVTQDFQCDLALSLFTSDDDIEVYAHHVATLKLLSKTPMVLSVIQSGAEEKLKERKSEIAADNFISLPVDDEEFTRIIKTCIAKLYIQKAKEEAQNHKFSRGTQTFGSILVENGIITPLQLKKALDHQQKTPGMLLGQALVTLGYIDEFQKTHFLASQLGVGVATPKQYASADMNVVSLIPDHIARENRCIALEKDGTELTVAMLDVTNLELLDSLRDITECTIVPVMGTNEEISIAIDRYYADILSQKDASALMADLGPDIEFLKAATEEIDPEKAAAEGAELGIIKLVNMLISNAVRDRASDIHIEPGENELNIRYRIDGEMRRMMSPPKHSHQAITTRIKILSDLNIAERRLPQDGRMVVRVGKREVDLRVSSLPTIHGEKIVLRILDKESFQSSMKNLGFQAHELKIFKENIARPYGMVVVTGPTGSGKSTTLYAALESIKSVATNIISVEDPVEFHLEHVNQVQVNTAIGLTFGKALRSILRQDPDVILIGEIRDAETADIAVKMSLTGHMVFSTLHTNDAASAITRFVDIGVPPLLLTSCLNLIIAQRLVRKICHRCKIEYDPSPEFLARLELDAAAQRPKFYKGEGCVSCNGTGYLGRMGIFEMLQVTPAVRDLIIKNVPSHIIQEQALKEGMQTLRAAGMNLVLQGETTIEQVLAVTTGG